MQTKLKLLKLFSKNTLQIVKANRKKKVNITSSLSRCRDFVFIKDVTNCITNTIIIRNKSYKIFNLGAVVKINIKKLIYDMFMR